MYNTGQTIYLHNWIMACDQKQIIVIILLNTLSVEMQGQSPHPQHIICIIPNKIIQKWRNEYGIRTGYSILISSIVYKSLITNYIFQQLIGYFVLLFIGTTVK